MILDVVPKVIPELPAAPALEPGHVFMLAIVGATLVAIVISMLIGFAKFIVEKRFDARIRDARDRGFDDGIDRAINVVKQIQINCEEDEEVELRVIAGLVAVAGGREAARVELPARERDEEDEVAQAFAPPVTKPN